MQFPVALGHLTMWGGEEDTSWLSQRSLVSDYQEDDGDFETFVQFCYKDPATCDHNESDGVVIVHQNPPGTVEVLDSQGNFNVAALPVLPLGIDSTPPCLEVHHSPPPIMVDAAPPVSDWFRPLIQDEQLDSMQKKM